MRKPIRHLKWIIPVAATMVLLVCLVCLFGASSRKDDMGWSLHNDSDEIAVDIPEYEEGLQYWENMDYQKAKDSLQTALQLSNERHGTGSLISAQISRKLGAFYLEREEFDNAYECLNSAYVTFRKELGEQDGNTVLSKGQIAICDIKTGDAELGLASLNTLYDNTKYWKYKLEIGQMIAQCQRSLGNYEKAVEWYDVLGETYSKFGINNLDVVNLLNDYGVCMIEVGNYEEAVKALENAVYIWKQLDLPEDTTIARVYLNLAQACSWNDQFEEAKEWAENALMLETRLYGDDSLQVAVTYENLSHNYDVMEQHDVQLDYLNKALGMAEKAVGENHETVAVLWYDLGSYEMYYGTFERALQALEKSLEIRKNILNTYSAETLYLYQDLSRTCRMLGLYEDSIEYALDAVELSESLYGENSLMSAYSYITAAWALSDYLAGDEALIYAQKAFEIYTAEPEQAGDMLPYAYQTMGFVLLNNGDFETAASYLDEAILQYRNLGSGQEENIEVTQVLLDYANRQERYTDSIQE